jgi:O-antigen/teichoic acid export membrane protein
MKKNFFYYLLPSIIQGALAVIVFVPVTTYYLTPQDFGIVAILTMITGFVAPLVSVGAAWVLSSLYFKLSQKDTKELIFNLIFFDIVFRLCICFVFLLGAPVFLPVIVKNYKPEFLFYFKIALCGVLVNGTWPIVSYIIILRKEGKIFFILQIVPYIVSIVVIVCALSIFKLSTVALFLYPAVIALVSFFASIWYIRKDILFKPSIKWFSQIRKLGMLTIPMNFCEVLTSTIDRFFIQRWINLSQLGIYAHSRQYSQIFAMGPKAFSRTFVPEVLSVFSGKRDDKSLKKILTIWYGILCLTGIFVAFFSRDLVSFLTHNKFTSAGALVPIWFMLTFTHSFGVHFTQYLNVHKKSGFLAISGITVSIVFIAIGAGLIYVWGIVGAVVSAVLGNLTLHLVRRSYARKLDCPSIAEDKIICSIGIVLAIHIFNSLMMPGLIAKLMISAGLVALTIKLFYLVNPIRLGFKKLYCVFFGQ